MITHWKLAYWYLLVYLYVGLFVYWFIFYLKFTHLQEIQFNRGFTTEN